MIKNVCQCPAGKLASGMFCIDPEDLKNCPIGSYNDGKDNCLKCGLDCK
jgi:hypothetical protein